MADKGSTRARWTFSGRDYYQSIEHVRKNPETKFQVLNPTGTYHAGLSQIENWSKMVLYMGLYNPNVQSFNVQNLLEIDPKTVQISVLNIVQNRWPWAQKY